MAEGCIIEYVYYLHNIYQKKSEVAPGLYWVEECNSGYRKIALEEILSPANNKPRTDLSQIQRIGVRQELQWSRAKSRELEEQLRSLGVHINIGNDDQQRRVQELHFNVRTEREKIRQLTEDLDKQHRFVKSERKEARVTEKLIREIEQKNHLQRSFTLYEILFVHEKLGRDK